MAGQMGLPCSLGILPLTIMFLDAKPITPVPAIKCEVF
jgi:hypothetical protein